MTRLFLIASLLIFALTSRADAQCFVDKKLFLGSPGTFEYFGTAVAIDGDHALISIPRHVTGGLVQAYERDANGVWQFTQAIPFFGSFNGLFGSAISLSGDVAVIGAYYDSTIANNSGAAGIYRNGPAGWQLEDTVFGSFDDEFFGTHVHVDGDRLYVASQGTGFLFGAESGAIHVFKNFGGAWSEVTTIEASDAHSESTFGSALAVEGSTVVSSDSAAFVFPAGQGAGKVYIYEVSAGELVETQVFPSDPAALDNFGASVELFDGRLFVKSRSGAAGSVYVFEKVAGVWTEVDKVEPANPASSNFGSGMHATSTHLFVGASPFDAGSSMTIFERDGTQWNEVTVMAPDSVFDRFASSIDVFGNTALVGAPSDDTLANESGAAYFVDLSTLGQSFVACDPTVSIAAAGSTTFDLRATPSGAGLGYLVLGSASGTLPGTPAQGVTLPLNPDAYFAFTLAFPSSSTLANSAGTLDANGVATTTFQLPAGLPPALVGATIDHAYVVLDGGPTDVSNAVSIELVP